MAFNPDDSTEDCFDKMKNIIFAIQSEIRLYHEDPAITANKSMRRITGIFLGSFYNMPFIPGFKENNR